MNPDAPEIRPVVRRGRVDPVPIVVALAVAFVGLSIWKPWQPAPAVTPGPSDLAVVAPSPAGSPVASPALPARPPATADRLVVDAIDWTATGTRETYRSWGISIAYLPFRFIDEALVLREKTMRPTVRWVSVTPDTTRNALVDVSGAPVVGIGVTWPSDVVPVSVGLRYVGAVAEGRPTPAVTNASGMPVNLARALPALLQAEDANVGPYAGRSPEPAAEVPASGTYVLPPSGHARSVIDWLRSGWEPGLYAATVQLEDGRSVVLPFVLDSGT